MLWLLGIGRETRHRISWQVLPAPGPWPWLPPAGTAAEKSHQVEEHLGSHAIYRTGNLMSLIISSRSRSDPTCRTCILLQNMKPQPPADVSTGSCQITLVSCFQGFPLILFHCLFIHSAVYQHSVADKWMQSPQGLRKICEKRTCNREFHPLTFFFSL